MEQTIKGNIEDVSIKTGITNNNEWKRTVMKVGGKTMSSFDEDVAKDVLEGRLRVGTPIEVSYKVDGKYNNIISLLPLSAQEIVQIGEIKTADEIKPVKVEKVESVDWIGKEMRIIRQNVLNRAVELYLSDKYKNRDVDTQIKEICQIADELEEWIWREKGDRKKEGEYDEKTI